MEGACVSQNFILKAILESPRDIVIIALDRQYRYLAFNEAHRRVMKQIWNVDIHVGQNMLYDVVGREDDRERAKCHFDRALAGEHFVVVEEFGDEAFSRRYYEDAYGPIVDADGAVIGMTVYLTDITEQKHAQDQLENYRLRLESLVEERTAALRRSEELYRTLVLNAPVAAMVHRAGTVLFVNPAAVTLCAESDGERVVGRSVADFVHGSMVEQIESSRGLTGVELPFERVDGTSADVEWTSIPVDFDGAPATFSLVVDVSARKRMERERRRLEEQMRHTQKLESLGVLAGGIAHDFNNLLVGILGNADLGLRELETSETRAPRVSRATRRTPEERDAALRAQLGRIKLAATRAAELTSRMLAYAGKSSFTLRALDLNVLSNEMIDLMSVSISPSAKLELDLAPQPPAFEGDGVQIRQVLMNLVTNAADAVGDSPGKIWLKTSVVEADATLLSSMVVADGLSPGPYVCVEVSDTGGGMDEATRARIFEPFFTTKQVGRGLGLAAVLGIVRSHRGGLTVSSEVGRGSTFRVLFPIIDRKPVVEEASAREGSSWRGSGTMILADDEPRVREVLRMMLSDVGFRVIEADSATTCIDAWHQHRAEVTLVMVDLIMPGGGGGAVVSALREQGECVPVVISSGYSEDAIDASLRNDPLVVFLEKPFELETLVRTIRGLLERSTKLGRGAAALESGGAACEGIAPVAELRR
jgi:two-component system, cell cycle sensor histidine kinase and response regulator CckA